MRQAIEDIELEIGNLRAIISDLRPSLLDDLGLLPAIEALLDRRRDTGMEIAAELELPDRHGAGRPSSRPRSTGWSRRRSPTSPSTRARATWTRRFVGLTDDHVIVEVRDDGVGFDLTRRTSGFGLAGMRERVYLAGGELTIEPAQPGTLVRCRLPTRRLSDTSRRRQAPIRRRLSANWTSSARVRDPERLVDRRPAAPRSMRLETCSLAAISLLVWPSAIRRTISVWRGLRPSRPTARRSACKPGATRGLTNSSPRAGAPDRGHKLGVGLVLEDQADRPGLDRLLGVKRTFGHRQGDDLGLRQPGPHWVDRVRGCAGRRAQIHHQHGGVGEPGRNEPPPTGRPVQRPPRSVSSS